MTHLTDHTPQQPSDTPTPRTDAASRLVRNYADDEIEVCRSDFARTLERENAALARRVAEAEKNVQQERENADSALKYSQTLYDRLHAVLEAARAAVLAMDALIILGEQHVPAPYGPLKERFARDRLRDAVNGDAALTPPPTGGLT